MASFLQDSSQASEAQRARTSKHEMRFISMIQVGEGKVNEGCANMRVSFETIVVLPNALFSLALAHAN